VESLLHDSSIGGLFGRAVPLVWQCWVGTVAFKVPTIVAEARWLLRHHHDVMLLADVASLTMT